jgi:hypothetical protein
LRVAWVADGSLAWVADGPLAWVADGPLASGGIGLQRR